jgi:hypothetical protein
MSEDSTSHLGETGNTVGILFGEWIASSATKDNYLLCVLTATELNRVRLSDISAGVRQDRTGDAIP